MSIKKPANLLVLSCSIMLVHAYVHTAKKVWPDTEGNTALHLASCRKYVADSGDTSDAEQVRTLITEGADINAVNLYGQTPLLLACLAKPHADIAVIRQLISADNINLADKKGITPLIAFCKEGTRSLPYGSPKDPHPTERSFEALQLLLENGADIAAKDHCPDGPKSALDYARYRIYIRLQWHQGKSTETYPDVPTDPDELTPTDLAESPSLLTQISALASAAYDLATGVYTALRRA